MKSQTGQQIYTLHILPNISINNSKWTINFGQLIEYNMRNIFLGESYTNCGREASPRLFYKNQNWA